jgi:hypothetical protein
MNVLKVGNEVQKALFEMEIVGQLSDGRWENSKPHDHWEPWSNCEVTVDRAFGRNFYAPKDNYNLTESSLLEIIGDRMVAFARLTIAFGIERAKKYEALLDIDGKWRDIPTYEGQYYDDVRKALEGENLDAIRSTVEHGNYNRHDLKRDLRALKDAMKTVIM